MKNQTKQAIKSTFKVFVALLILLTVLQTAKTVFGAPQLMANYYGDVSINGLPAKIGTDVAVFSNGKVCGRFIVKQEGKYGLINCDTPLLNEVYFEVNGKVALQENISKMNINLKIIDAKSSLDGLEFLALFLLIVFFGYLIFRRRKK